MIRSAVACLLVLAACGPAASPASAPGFSAVPPGEPELPRDARRWVEATLASLTLREKAAQLVMPWIGGEYTAVDSPEFDRLLEWVERDRVGGLIVSIGLPHSYAAKLNALQERARVPLLITSDMENGPGMRLARIYSLPHLLPQGGGTMFPPSMALGATGSEELAFEMGRITGREARAVGVHMTFGPVLDVNSNPDNPIINTRSFGEDPALVARLGAAYIRGAHSAGLLTTGKHFPGHGDAATDSHIDLPVIARDRAQLDSTELAPFRAAVGQGIDGIMSAHIAVTGVLGEDAPPATLASYFLRDVLREEMDFRGLVFTDAMTMGGVAKRFGPTEPLILALEAGADILLMPRDVSQAIETVAGAVESGRLSEERLDASVRRVLATKARLGLHKDARVDLDRVDEIVGIRPHTAVAEQVAERSLTLVRDEGRLVPLPADVRRVLSVTFAEGADLVAGRSFDRELQRPGLEVEAVRVDHRTSPAEWEALWQRADSADLVVASAYVSPREYRGTVAVEDAFPAFVEGVSTEGTPVVAISFGNPYLLEGFPSVPAYLLAWGGEEVSQRAAARALLGEIPITGTLPISLPPDHPVGAGIRREARRPAP